MFDLLHTHIRRRITLSDEDAARVDTFFTPRKLRKRQYLLQEGDVSRHIAFVTSGCMRLYTVDARGDEHVIQFAIEDWWVADLQSFLSETPAAPNIDAVEDSELLLLEKSAREALLAEAPCMERFFRLLQEEHYIATHRRINAMLSASAEERYLAFMRLYPKLFDRVPQAQIASYLGITPQSLSRIRRELAHKP